MSHVFADRTRAGMELAHALKSTPLRKSLLVLALPRGGVPVAFEVARALHAPLDVMVVRKIGLPGQPERAVGAIASGGVTVREPGVTHVSGLTFEHLAAEERLELLTRERTYRHSAPPLALNEKSVILVDDGLATGSTMLAAVRAARRAGASEVIAAAPVGSDEAVALVGGEADRIEVLKTPTPFHSVGSWYEDFDPVTDEEVVALLDRASQLRQSAFLFGLPHTG